MEGTSNGIFTEVKFGYICNVLTGILDRRAGRRRRIRSGYMYTRQISLGKRINHRTWYTSRTFAIKLDNRARVRYVDPLLRIV